MLIGRGKGCICVCFPLVRTYILRVEVRCWIEGVIGNSTFVGGTQQLLGSLLKPSRDTLDLRGGDDKHSRVCSVSYISISPTAESAMRIQPTLFSNTTNRLS
jgi:hypothetical protein